MAGYTRGLCSRKGTVRRASLTADCWRPGALMVPVHPKGLHGCETDDSEFHHRCVGFANLLLLAATGAIMKWILPPGSGGGHGYGFRGGRGPSSGVGQVGQLLGLGRHDWGDIHFILAVSFVSLILVHIILHWTWIKTCAKSIFFPSRKVSCESDRQPDGL